MKKNRNVLRSHSRKKVYFLYLDTREKVIKNNYKLQLYSPGALATRYAGPFHRDDPLSIPDNKLHNFCLVKLKKIKQLTIRASSSYQLQSGTPHTEAACGLLGVNAKRGLHSMMSE